MLSAFAKAPINAPEAPPRDDEPDLSHDGHTGVPRTWIAAQKPGWYRMPRIRFIFYRQADR
jgi:hypothetical protein